MKDRRPPAAASGPPRPRQHPRRLDPEPRDVVDQLDRAGLLPAIVFIFSRVGCDAAVQQCLNANLRLTSPAERDEIATSSRSAAPTCPTRTCRCSATTSSAAVICGAMR